MADLKKFFDVGKLTDHQLGCIEYVLNSPAYLDVFEPFLISIREAMQSEALDRSAARKEQLSDDYLAGGIVSVNCLLELFKKIVAETRMERMIAAQAVSPVTRYDNDQREGRHDPVLGANEPLVYETAPGDVPPEEDY